MFEEHSEWLPLLILGITIEAPCYFPKLKNLFVIVRFQWKVVGIVPNS